MGFCWVLLLVVLTTPSQAEETGPFPDLNVKDPASLQEATRVLEEEVKLATRPQTYLLVDLVTRTIHIKGRGLDLYHIPIIAWSFKSPDAVTGTHRLIARPPILRRKIDPTASTEQEPISLADMPVDYTLSFSPALTIDVMPSYDHSPLQWIAARGKTWWRQLKEWSASLSTGQSVPPSPSLQLEISAEQAQSLAWSAVEGMPLVIRRTTDKK
jgi:hypothetical protein